MSFFDSEVVRAEMSEISDLQEDIYKNVFKFYSMSKEEKYHHVLMLKKLLEKQKILYTRMSLSDDPEAKQAKQRIVDSATLMGLPSDVDMGTIFNNMSEMLDAMEGQTDKTGSDQ